MNDQEKMEAIPDLNGQDETVKWYLMEVYGELDLFGINKDGDLLNVERVTVTPSDHRYQQIMSAIDELAQEIQGELL